MTGHNLDCGDSSCFEQFIFTLLSSVMVYTKRNSFQFLTVWFHSKQHWLSFMFSQQRKDNYTIKYYNGEDNEFF